MSSLSAKDRASLCSFTFSDGRRCRTPRVGNHPHFCFYHAQKEARARARQSLGKDLAYYFSGNYLSACDLGTALACLIPAVIRGDVKPKTARTVAYLAQTLLQTIRMSQDEYINTFGTDGWRKSIRNSVNANHTYRFPPAPKPEPGPEPPPDQAPHVVAGHQTGGVQAPPPVGPPANCHSDAVAQAFRPEESASSSHSSLATHHSFTPSEAEGPLPQTPSPHTPLPPTSAEFAQHLLAGRNLSRSGQETGAGQAPRPAQTPPSQPVATPVNCHPEPAARRQGSASSSSPLPQVQEPASAPPSTPPHPAAQPIPALPSTPPHPAPAPQPFVSLALPPHVRRRLHRYSA